MEPSDDPHVSALFDDLQSYDGFEHPQHLNQRHEPVYTGTDDYADANAYNSNPFVSAHEEAYMGGEDVVYDDFGKWTDARDWNLPGTGLTHHGQIEHC